ncbi:thymidylate synthase [Candidatus Berkelbacteria bacterium]|nr:thymidylate synthase [Candidatus Berkelbacteria bacterium]
MISYTSYELRKPDRQYKNGLRRILKGGFTQPTTRQGPPSTLNPRGYTMEYRLSNGFPFDTLRNLRGAFHKFAGELLWILSGDTSLELLNRYGVHYWDAWADEAHCARAKLQTGQFGATYGHQFRNFNGTHLGGGFFERNGFDQFKYVIENLRKEPTLRRWLITPFNPSTYGLVDIVPCHGELFFISVKGKLYLHLVQRSGDFPIGIPSNQVMWGIFGEIVARLTGHEFVHLTHFVSNPHIYGDPNVPLELRHPGCQCRGVEMMLERMPTRLPTVQVLDPVIDAVNLMLDGVIDPISRADINPEGLTHEEFLKRHISLDDYHPGPAIPRELLPVSV